MVVFVNERMKQILSKIRARVATTLDLYIKTVMYFP